MSFLTRLDKVLAGAPDAILSALLYAVAGVAVLIAWRGQPAVKAFIAAWFLLP